VQVGRAPLARRIAGAVSAPGRCVEIRGSLEGAQCELAIVSGDSVEELDGCDARAALIVVETPDDALLLKVHERRVRGLIDRDESDQCLRTAADGGLRNDGLFIVSFSLVHTFQELVVAPATAADPTLPLPGDKLTPREKEVVPLVRAGLSNRSIAQRMFITESAVKQHVSNLLSKYGVNNRIQLAALLNGHFSVTGESGL